MAANANMGLNSGLLYQNQPPLENGNDDAAVFIFKESGREYENVVVMKKHQPQPVEAFSVESLWRFPLL